MFPLLTSLGPDLTRIAVLLQSSNRRVRPRLVWRNGTLLASPVVHGVTGHFSSCVWYLRAERSTCTILQKWGHFTRATANLLFFLARQHGMGALSCQEIQIHTRYRYTVQTHRTDAQFHRVPQAPVLLFRLLPSFVDVRYKPRCGGPFIPPFILLATSVTFLLLLFSV